MAECSSNAGFKLEKKIAVPSHDPLLAEFLGIVIGDGSISDYQVRIYFNAKTDAVYAGFVKDLVLQLFQIGATLAKRPKNTLELIISSRALVKFLSSAGLQKGNKVKNQIAVPAWIQEDSACSHACLRGLMDTDGGVYFHTHITKGIKYRHMGLCFTSRSRPLLDAVEQVLLQIGIPARNDERERVEVYSKDSIEKYMNLIGSHNLNHLKRFRLHKNTIVA